MCLLSVKHYRPVTVFVLLEWLKKKKRPSTYIANTLHLVHFLFCFVLGFFQIFTMTDYIIFIFMLYLLPHPEGSRSVPGLPNNHYTMKKDQDFITAMEEKNAFSLFIFFKFENSLYQLCPTYTVLALITLLWYSASLVSTCSIHSESSEAFLKSFCRLPVLIHTQKKKDYLQQCCTFFSFAPNLVLQVCHCNSGWLMR